jgi:anti-sigma factor RsiW
MASEKEALNSRCPNDQNHFAEQFCLGKLSPDAERAFAVHMQGCKSCRQVYQEWKDWVESVRAAALKTREIEESIE